MSRLQSLREIALGLFHSRKLAMLLLIQAGLVAHACNLSIERKMEEGETSLGYIDCLTPLQ